MKLAIVSLVGLCLLIATTPKLRKFIEFLRNANHYHLALKTFGYTVIHGSDFEFKQLKTDTVRDIIYETEMGIRLRRYQPGFRDVFTLAIAFHLITPDEVEEIRKQAARDSLK